MIARKLLYLPSAEAIKALTVHYITPMFWCFAWMTGPELHVLELTVKTRAQMIRRGVGLEDTMLWGINEATS